MIKKILSDKGIRKGDAKCVDVTTIVLVMVVVTLSTVGVSLKAPGRRWSQHQVY